MKYIGLRLNDNWGNQSYCTKGKNSREVEFTEGQELNVKWPDDIITKEKVRMRGYTEHINDMGNEYSVSGQLPTLRIKFHGLEVIVENLEGLKFRDDELKLKGEQK